MIFLLVVIRSLDKRRFLRVRGAKVASPSISGYYCDLRDMLLKKKKKKKKRNAEKGEGTEKSIAIPRIIVPHLAWRRCFALLSDLLVQNAFLVSICSRKENMYGLIWLLNRGRLLLVFTFEVNHLIRFAKIPLGASIR